MTRSPAQRKRWLTTAVLTGVIASVGSAAIVDVSSAATGTERVLELVSPPDKDFDLGALFGNATAIASADGESVAFNAQGPLPGSDSGSQQNYYVARRGAEAWSVRPVSPPVTPLPGGSPFPDFERGGGFSSDLRYGVFVAQDPPLTPDAVPGFAELYRRDTTSGAYDLLSQGDVGTYTQVAVVAGASDDFSHIVFESLDVLLPEGQQSGASPGAYEWVDGELRYAGILPDGSPAPMSIVGGWAGAYRRASHAVSDDGRRIVFGDNQQQLYVREDGATTVLVSGSQRAVPDPNGTAPAQFWGASANGGKIVFTSRGALTDDANTGTDGSGNLTDAGTDLYLYDHENGGELHDLSVDTNPADSATGAAVQGVVGMSDDASYVYFVALGDLGGEAVSGSPNLYVWHDGQVRYIATLSVWDAANWTVVQSTSAGLTSRVSASGRFVALQSVGPLTGYDNTDAVTGAADTEIFRYDAHSNELVCVSCRPDGSAPRGSASITPPPFLLNTTRNLTESGTVFFESADDLVASDTNGRTDVYQYADGLLSLISSGTSRYDTHFHDASSSGSDVFITTRAQLVSSDRDDEIDLYDARVGGRSAPQAPEEGCAALLCSGPSAGGIPEAVAPGSVGLNGTGNVLSLRTPKLRFAIGRLSAAQRKRAAQTGRLLLPVRVTGAGVIKVTARASIHGALATIAHARRRASRPGTFRLALPLNKAARDRLAQHRRLRLRLTVTFSKAAGAKRATVSLHR